MIEDILMLMVPKLSFCDINNNNNSFTCTSCQTHNTSEQTSSLRNSSPNRESQGYSKDNNDF